MDYVVTVAVDIIGWNNSDGLNSLRFDKFPYGHPSVSAWHTTAYLTSSEWAFSGEIVAVCGCVNRTPGSERSIRAVTSSPTHEVGVCNLQIVRSFFFSRLSSKDEILALWSVT
ncbi:hypothetical protein PROFUN_08547 [Planoprotostelium fungivorum]|uniref:Uncharacterized protein n=1 Tax=Planoprotostelium fungivorum TaxID=1890364 RepID=A0A2P6N1R3_9EUKA|nr:hypothetical protein PROFUN_08547 [Planoprotostelium fungivorum]